MEGTPKNIAIQTVIDTMERVEGVLNIHHVHLWQLDERRNALEAQVIITSFSETCEDRAC